MEVAQESVFADYVLGRFRLGHDYLAAFLASALFERLINKKLEDQDPTLYWRVSNDPDENSLKKKINLLNEKTLVSDATEKFPVFNVGGPKEVRGKLHHFRELRNDLIHANQSIDRMMISETRKNKLCELILYVVAETNPSFFAEKFQNIRKIKINQLHEAINETTSDYLIREVDETMVRRYDRILTKEKKRQYFNGIEKSDFENLFTMRKKLVYLRHDLRQWLRQSSEMFHRRMRIPVISTIDTTSGYIWMPIVHDLRHLSKIERPNIEMPVVSVVATPINLQIYLGFGGKALRQRLRYLDFISEANGDFEKFINELPSDDLQGLQYFDTTWYAFVTSQFSVNDRLSNATLKQKIAAHRRELESWDKNAEIATGGKLQCGYVLESKLLSSEGVTREFLFSKLTVLLELYHQFLRYSFPYN